MMAGRWRATTGGKGLLQLWLAWWLVFLVPARRVAALFAELVQRLAVVMAAVSTVGKEFTLGSRLLDVGTGGSTDTAILVGRRGRMGRHLLALFAAELVVALMALDTFCIRFLGDAADHHDVEGADALVLALVVVCHGVPTGCAGPCWWTASPWPQRTWTARTRRSSCAWTSSQWGGGTMTSACRMPPVRMMWWWPVESELDNSLLLPFLFLGRVPSLDCEDGRLAMGCLRCIATQSTKICQVCASTLQELTR
jgi:hypothetical protein